MYGTGLRGADLGNEFWIGTTILKEEMKIGFYSSKTTKAIVANRLIQWWSGRRKWWAMRTLSRHKRSVIQRKLQWPKGNLVGKHKGSKPVEAPIKRSQKSEVKVAKLLLEQWGWEITALFFSSDMDWLFRKTCAVFRELLLDNSKWIYVIFSA